MQSPALQERLEKAATVDAVMAAVGDYMLALTPQDLDRLPRYNRPNKIETAESLDRWTRQLGRYEPPPSQDPLNSVIFLELREYLMLASRRIDEMSRA